MEESVVRFLAERHIHVKEEWLSNALAFVKLHGRGSKEEDLHRAIFEQLIFSDLTESYEPLTKVPVVALKAVIVKPMIFQQYCECISNNDDLSWFHGDDEENSQKSGSELHLTNPGGRRLLKLELTDGQNVVHAIEYGGKLDLDEQTLPGTKVLLTARALLRRGTLLLNSSNCQILGGDVEGDPLDLASFFAKRIGIQHDPKTNRRVEPDAPVSLPLLAESEVEKPARKLSTISPYLVRVPRIAPELLENPETDAKSSHVEVKKEVYDFERTAIVPPLQSMPSANQVELKGRRLTDEFPESAMTSGMNSRLLLPIDDFRSSSTASTSEDPSTILSAANVLPHALESTAQERKRLPERSTVRNDVGDLNQSRSIANYFPVTRLRRGCERVYSKPEDEWKSSKDTTDPIHVGPPSYQHSVVVLDEDDKVMNSELRSRDAGEPRNVGLSPPHSAAPDSNFASEHVPLNREVRESASGRANLYGDNAPLGVASKPASFVEQRTPPLRDSWLPPPSLRQLSRGNSSPAQLTLPPELKDSPTPDYPKADFYSNRRADIGVRRKVSFVEPEVTDIATTQQLLCPPERDTFPMQDPEFLSFIEESVSGEVAEKESHSPLREDDVRELPSTAVVPFKRMRSDSSRSSSVPVASWPASFSRARNTVIERFMELKVVRLADAFAQRKFWMLPKTVHVMGVCHLNGELTAKRGSWKLDITISDESVSSQECVVDSLLLERLLGFSVRHCEIMHHEKNGRELSRCKGRAIEVMKSFQRLDLVLLLEIYPQRDKLPVLVNVRTLAEAIDAC